MADVGWQSLLTAITITSVLLTVGIGIGALRQGYYYRGEITARGRRARRHLVALGLVTLLSGFASQKISDVKDRQETEARDRQFNTQMSSLQATQRTLADSIRRQQRLTENIRDVQTKVDDSLARQEGLAAAAEQNILMLRRLQAQDAANTARVINRVAEETSRFTLGDLEVTAVTNCPPRSEGLPRPTHWDVSLSMRGPAGGTYLSQSSLEQPGNLVIFDRLTGNLDNFDIARNWLRSRITIRVSAADREYANEALRRFGASWTEVRRARLRSRTPLNCPLYLFVTGKGRILFQVQGTLVERTDGGFGATFPDMRPDPRSFMTEPVMNFDFPLNIISVVRAPLISVPN